MKKMIAYSSIAHMGYVILGIFSFNKEGIKGAIFQMISHAIISASLFFIVGMLYERNHTKDINKYGGVARNMPLLATFFMIAVLGSIGLPGTSGFIGEFFAIVGIAKVNIKFAAIAAFGMILSAIYMLKLYKKIMLGPVSNEVILNFHDIRSYEIATLAPLITFIIYLGLRPENIMRILDLSINKLIE
jgi:NADH-quinone oxidoreductase subunit M